MVRRKSIARRLPYIVYRVEPTDNGAIAYKAWIGDKNGRLIRDKRLGDATLTDWAAEPIKGQWIVSNDTDAIHGLPEEVRNGLWEFDDALRKAMG